MNNNIEIIPSILVNSLEEFQEKVNQVEDYTKWVQLDVADGDFAPATAWGDPVQIHNFDTSVSIEAHLMVAAPENVIDNWIQGQSEEHDSGIGRIYFHWEATSKHEEIIKKIRDAGKEAGIAILPETPISVLENLLNSPKPRESHGINAVLIFSGNLGYYGGSAKWEINEEITLNKISSLRGSCPDLIIEVDGGMNPETAKKVVAAGANSIVSGSYIWNHEEGPQKAIEELEKSINL